MGEGLRQRVWPPMTYMMIPSLLAEADRLLDVLAACPEPGDEVRQALEELRALRADFRRER